MDLLEGLTQLGLNEHEGRAYAALLAHPGSAGYEVAGHSGVPRGRIYDALGGLAAKGAAHTSGEGDRTLYHPVNHDTLLRRHRERAEQLAAMLGPALAELAGSQTDAPFITIRGSEALLSRAEDPSRPRGAPCGSSPRRGSTPALPCRLPTGGPTSLHMIPTRSPSP